MKCRHGSDLLCLSIALAFSTCWLSGCAAADALGTTPRLPSYTAHAVTLFDDRIEPRAVGSRLESGTSDADGLLRERTRVSDCVARVRVVTIASKQERSVPSWQMRLQTLERLAGKCPADDPTLVIDAASPAAGIVRTFDGQLVGMTLVAFLREFASSDGSAGSDLHFHLAGEGNDELRSVRVYALLGDVH